MSKKPFQLFRLSNKKIQKKCVTTEIGVIPKLILYIFLINSVMSH